MKSLTPKIPAHYRYDTNDSSVVGGMEKKREALTHSISLVDASDIIPTCRAGNDRILTT